MPAAIEDTLIGDPQREPARVFEQMHLGHSEALHRFLRARLGKASDADDVLQDTWVRVWRTLPTGFHGGNVRAWLFQIARTALIDWLRKHRKSQQSASFDEAIDLPSEWSHPAPGRLTADQEWFESNVSQLRSCVEKLEQAAPQKAKLVRGKIQGRNYQELCRELDLKPERAYRIYFDACQTLKDCMKASP